MMQYVVCPPWRPNILTITLVTLTEPEAYTKSACTRRVPGKVCVGTAPIGTPGSDSSSKTRAAHKGGGGASVGPLLAQERHRIYMGPHSNQVCSNPGNLIVTSDKLYLHILFFKIRYEYLYVWDLESCANLFPSWRVVGTPHTTLRLPLRKRSFETIRARFRTIVPV